MSVATSWGSGLYIASRRHIAMFDRREKMNNQSRGVIFLHNIGVDGYINVAPAGGAPNLSKVMRDIAEAGFIVVAPDYGNDTYGNDTAMTRVTAAKDFLANTLKAKTDKFILVGWSLGGMTAANWAKRNPTLIQGVVTFAGVANAQHAYDNGHSAAMDAAYGGSWSTNAAARDPIQFAAADLTGKPWRLYYADDDTTVLPAHTTALASAIGGTASALSMGNGGHDDDPLGNFDRKDLVDYLKGLG